MSHNVAALVVFAPYMMRRLYTYVELLSLKNRRDNLGRLDEEYQDTPQQVIFNLIHIHMIFNSC